VVFAPVGSDPDVFADALVLIAGALLPASGDMIAADLRARPKLSNSA
jgi:hypothetical protein